MTQQITDSSISAAGYPGLRYSHPATGANAAYADNFSFGDPGATFSSSQALTSGGTISFGTVLNTAVVANATGIVGGQIPYSVQFQRAPDVSGSPGTYANIGVPISSLLTSVSYSDGSVSATTKYWYQAIVTDNLGATQTTTGTYVLTPATAATLDTVNTAIQSVLALLQAG